MIASSNRNKKRLIFVFIIFCLLCTGLTFRVGWIQVVASEEYAKLAVEQQTMDTPIPAKRGVIYDRNGKELAISAVTGWLTLSEPWRYLPLAIGTLVLAWMWTRPSV